MHKKLLYALLLAVPPILGGLYIYLYSVNLVMADEFRWAEWASGPLPPLSRLLYRHDAHVIFFPAIAYLTLAKVTAVNGLSACWLSFSLVVLLYLAVAFFTFQRLPKVAALVICLLVGAALFHPAQRANTLWGNQIGFYMTFVFSCFAFLAFAYFFRTGRESESKLALAATICCAVVASFSSAQGILTWPIILCCWLGIAGKEVWRSWRFYLFCLALILAFSEFAYLFRSYSGTTIVTMLQQPLGAAEYFASLLDNACMTGTPPFIKGWALAAVAAACCLHFLFRPRTTAMFPFMMIVYGLGTALQTTSGRMDSGWLSALTSSRYCTFTLTILWGGILYLAVVFAPAAVSRLGNIRRVAVAAVLCLAGIWLIASIGPNLKQTQLVTYPTLLHRAYILRTIDFQPDRAVRQALAPDVRDVRRIVAILREKKLNLWADVGGFPQTPDIFTQPASPAMEENPFVLNSLTIESSGGSQWLAVNGWTGGAAAGRWRILHHLRIPPITWFPVEPDDSLAQSVWLNVGGRRFPLFYGWPRPDAAAYFSVETILYCGFSGDIKLTALPEGSYPLAFDVVNGDGSQWIKHDTGAVLTCSSGGDCFLSVAGAKTDMVELPAIADKLTEELAPSAFYVDNAVIDTGDDGPGLVVSGWIYDQRAHLPMKRGWLKVGERRVPLLLGGKRSDVAREFHDQNLSLTGFFVRVPIAGLEAGSYPLRIEMVGRTGLNLYQGDSDFVLTTVAAGEGADKWLVQRTNEEDSRVARENIAPADEKPSRH